MSTDTVLFALTTVQRQYVACDTDALHTDQKYRFNLTTDFLRDQLLRGDHVAFTNSINSGMAAQPDLYDFLLEALFEQLNVTTREQFDAILEES